MRYAQLFLNLNAKSLENCSRIENVLSRACRAHIVYSTYIPPRGGGGGSLLYVYYNLLFSVLDRELHASHTQLTSSRAHGL